MACRGPQRASVHVQRAGCPVDVATGNQEIVGRTPGQGPRTQGSEAGSHPPRDGWAAAAQEPSVPHRPGWSWGAPCCPGLALQCGSSGGSPEAQAAGLRVWAQGVHRALRLRRGVAGVPAVEPGVTRGPTDGQSGGPGGRAILAYQRLDGASENKDPEQGLAASEAAFIVLGAASPGSVLDPARDLGGGSSALAWQPEGGQAEVAVGRAPRGSVGESAPW
ncbi:unnamed protein product [Rangifer tarandus platyrhynchus]|uniref:Uncharacterized protein n=1 Tax=Rangifer tarandus platyrhynchus TaxID=3082113 RepID=A0ABN8YBA7_RANTA|nr:unnamed protein product [Rangifer tarandus platyrhynchus]